ncbi:MAG: DinB family protein [Planctomycetota bacterium]|nr:DinB family protein [Planctomycetota bacterium]
MTPNEIGLLLEYHYWARDRALAAAAVLTTEQFTRDLGSSFGSVRDTLAHVYGADSIWCARWNGESPTSLPRADQFPDLAALRKAWAELEGRMRRFVGTLDAAGLDKTCTYTALNGKTATFPFWQMLQHLVNHGSYHRGQVATLLRQLGAAAGTSMDLIAFYRERAS